MFNVLRSSSADGTIPLTDPLDYETQSWHVLILQVCDVRGSCSDVANLTISVDDVNEPPIFSPDNVALTVLEELVGV